MSERAPIVIRRRKPCALRVPCPGTEDGKKCTVRSIIPETDSCCYVCECIDLGVTPSHALQRNVMDIR